MIKVNQIGKGRMFFLLYMLLTLIIWSVGTILVRKLDNLFFNGNGIKSYLYLYPMVYMLISVALVGLVKRFWADIKCVKKFAIFSISFVMFFQSLIISAIFNNILLGDFESTLIFGEPLFSILIFSPAYSLSVAGCFFIIFRWDRALLFHLIAYNLSLGFWPPAGFIIIIIFFPLNIIYYAWMIWWGRKSLYDPAS